MEFLEVIAKAWCDELSRSYPDVRLCAPGGDEWAHGDYQPVRYARFQFNYYKIGVIDDKRSASEGVPVVVAVLVFLPDRFMLDGANRLVNYDYTDPTSIVQANAEVNRLYQIGTWICNC